MTEEQREGVRTFSRQLEDAAFIVAIVIAALFGVGEFLIHIGIVTPPEHRDFPYMTLILFVGCVLPKYLGRATMGQIWIIIAQGVARMLPKWGKNGNGTPAMTIEATCEKCGNAMTACVCPEPAQ